MKQRLIDVNKYLEKVCTYKETGCGSCKLQTMCPADEPVVEAIPVELLKKQIENPPYSHSWELGERWKGEYATCIMVLLEDWEKENEQ